MSKKQKIQQSIPSSQPQGNRPGFLSFLWKSPFLSENRYFELADKISYGFTVLLFLLLILYFIKGYSIRPRILDRDFIPRILHLPADQSYEIYPIGLKGSFNKAISNDNIEGLLFHLGKGDASGLIVSKNLLTIPDDAKNIGIAISSTYQGIPTIYYGFTNRAPSAPVENWRTFFDKTTMINMEMPPSVNQMNSYFSMAMFFVTPDQFSVPWTKARYFFFLFTSSVPTEFFLDNLIFVEKQ